MFPSHTNPTVPRRDRENRPHSARAPYNFVPLPEKVVRARTPLLSHAVYETEGLTGWIDCTLETVSPVYIRGMMQEGDFAQFGRKKPDALTDDEKNKRASFFGTAGAPDDDTLQPIIPGSSLRGMIRSLVEIAGYGRMRWVGAQPTFTYRAVAASENDPLRKPYQEALGRFGSRVEAGYLIQDGERWYIQPARRPKDNNWPEKAAYLKVKERNIGPRDLPNLIRFNDDKYRPQIHEVSFSVERGRSDRGAFTDVRQIGPREAGFPHKGVLVCSGNMLETGQLQAGQRSPRKSHALILEREDDRRAKRLTIPSQVVSDYLNGLTPFQQEKLTDWSGEDGTTGCLAPGKPVFYVARGDEVLYFGHSPNFRVPARLNVPDGERAATPADFVPPMLRDMADPDLADAIFGWVAETGQKAGLLGQRAGRVFFGDARLTSPRDDVWLEKEMTPHVLAGPKPTTFQHYLVQDKTRGHDPDRKESLAYYGVPPAQTQIRGYKLYWHKGARPDLKATTQEMKHPSQLTRITPVKPGVQFSFRLRFDNLRPEELGALLWALALPGEDGQRYCHKLGMGKPLGMGAVQIVPTLFLSDRQARYQTLFADDGWDEAARAEPPQSYITAFETFVLEQVKEGEEALLSQVRRGERRLKDEPRIRMLLTLLQWREGDAAWLDRTRYMEIERGLEKVNEYKERPVLPDPVAVAGEMMSAQVPATPRAAPTPGPAPTPGVPTGFVTGRVKKFGLGPTQSFGFIQPDDGGDDVFVHRSQLEGGLVTLLAGQRVVFRRVQGVKGPEARNVRLEK